MPDRLQELRRQRALVQEHLAWLDGEIAAVSGQASASTPAPHLAPAARAMPSPTPSASSYLAGQAAAIARHASSVPVAASSENPAVHAAAEAILEEYRVPADSLKTDVRKGCFLYFFIGLALLGAGVTALYFLLSKR